MALLKKKEYRHGNMSLVIDKLQKRKFRFFYNGEYAYCEVAIRNNESISLYTTRKTVISPKKKKEDILFDENVVSIIEITREMMRDFNLTLFVPILNFSSLFYYHMDELRDYWIGSEKTYIFSNKERAEFVKLGIPIHGESSSPTIPYQSDKSIHDVISCNSDIHTPILKKYGCNLLVKNVDDFENSTLKIDKEYFTVTLHGVHDEPLGVDEIIKFPELEIESNLGLIHLKVRNELRHKNAIDFSGLPENVHVSFQSDTQEQYSLIEDWDNEFKNVSRTLDTLRNKEQLLTADMFEAMIKKSYSSNMVFQEINNSGLVKDFDIRIKVSSGDPALNWAYWAYTLAKTLNITMPETIKQGRSSIFTPTIKNYMIFQKGYSDVVHKFTEAIINNKIEEEKKFREDRETNDKKSEEFSRFMISDIESRKNNLFGLPSEDTHLNRYVNNG